MGLGDFILLIEKLGVTGFIITLLFVITMLMGSVVDIYQFLWRIRRHKKRRERSLRDRIKAQVLMEIHENYNKK